MSLGKAIRRSIIDHGVEATNESLTEAFANGSLNQGELSLRGLAQDTLGDNWAIQLEAYAKNPYVPVTRGREAAADAVDPSAFASIVGNQLINTVKEKYKSPEFIGDSICKTIPVTNGNLDTEKVPWLSDTLTASDLLDETDADEDIVEAGMPYNRTGFKPNYWVLQRPRKRGKICDVTFEMIYSDRTRQAIDSAGSVGRRLGRSKEYRILKAFLGITNTYTYSFGGAAELNTQTFMKDASSAPWINHVGSTALTDWTTFNTAEQLFNQMRDPVTGEPIDIQANSVFVMPARYHKLLHILNSTGTREGASQTSDPLTYAPNTLKAYTPFTSKYAYKLASVGTSLLWASVDYANAPSTLASTGVTLTASQANDITLIGNFKEGLYYREVYPLRVMQAPPMNPDEFNRDVVLSVKAQEYGVAGISDPRQMVRLVGHNMG